MAAYLYPNLKSKKAYKEALKQGKQIYAMENTPFGSKEIDNGEITFEGPHFPEPHRFYGIAVVKNGLVVSIK